MLKTTLIISLLLISMSLFAQGTFPDIYDTLYVVLSMQGGIGYDITYNNYMGGVTPSTEIEYEAGDGYNQFINSEISVRSYTSFPTTTIPENYRLDSATIYIREAYCYGDGEGGIFPIWYNGDDFPCMLAHVDYGESLDLGDWEPVFYEDIGILTNSWIFDYVSLDMTSAYLADVQANRQYSQLMIYFHILTDYDHLPDQVFFSNGYDPDCPPMLVLHYVTTAGMLIGQVKEANTINSISGATISCGNYSTTTDEDGMYYIEIPGGENQVTCTDSLYQTLTLTTDIISNELNVLNFELQSVGNDDETSTIIPISIFPNPVKDNFTIKADDTSSIEKVALYNLKGQRMDNIKLISKSNSVLQATLNRETLPTGVYIHRFTYNNSHQLNKYSKKIVIL